MGSAANQNASDRRRSPYRHSLFRTLLALFGAPVAWVIQMSLSEPIAAYACYPHQAPLSTPLWVELPTILATISLVCLAAGLFSGYVAWTFWQQTGSAATAVMRPSNSQRAVADGGQNHFLAMIGLMSSSIFIIAILFTCIAVFLVSPCSAWA